MKKILIKMYIFLMLAIASSLAIPVTYSIYKNENNNSVASVLVANWNVSLEQTGVSNSLNLVPEESNATYNLNVKSLSGVDISYTIVISNIPTGVEVSIDGTNFVAGTNGTATFSNAGTILHGDSNRISTKTITFRGTSSATTATNLPIYIDVIARQIV